MRFYEATMAHVSPPYIITLVRKRKLFLDTVGAYF